MEGQCTIEGVVEDIIYTNEENGYTVCTLQTEEEDIVCVGILPGVHPGENLQILGTWKVHPTYGEQLQVETYEKSIPKTEHGIEKYLASGVIKGIGPTLANRIVKHFGVNTLRVIEEEPECLEVIKGISLQKAQEIGSIFQQQRELRTAMLFLQDYGISPTYALKIYKKYRGQTMDVIKINPYRLADEIFGIGFKMADQIAASVGIEKDSEHRIKAGIKYVLNEGAGNGHTYLPLKLLMQRAEKLLQVPQELMENALIDLQIHKQVWQEVWEEETRIYLMPFYYAERSVGKKILELASLYEPQDDIQIQNRITQLEKEQRVQLADCQKQAIQAAMENGVLIITGGPGTGKTTTINTIITLLQDQDQEVILAAPTGRAAKRMTEATGMEAQTIHRLLEITFLQEDSRSQSFEKNEENPLEADVIIIDETSMVDILLMNSLLKAIMPGTRLILVGDMDQLPSVGPGNVLKDLIHSQCLPVVRLTEIFRQAGESAIVTNAHRINTGQYPVLNQKEKDFFFLRRAVQEEVAQTVIELITKRLPPFLSCDPMQDIQILCPMRKGPLGVIQLNQELQKALNPPSKKKKEKEFRHTLFREGDKVMQIKNNYNIPWKICNPFGYPLDEGVGIFNGDCGIITDISATAETLTVTFDDNKVVEYDYSQLDELELAYAVTIHKAQGSEYPAVVLPIHSGPPMLMSRNLLYTGVTRAKELVVIVGLESTLERMVDNNREINRYSGLKGHVQKLVQLYSKGIE